MSEAQFMRLIVFFDLPVTTAAKRKAANRFRKFLQKDGYQMLQLSVYSRIVRGRDALQKHHKRLLQQLPEEGQVRYLEVTEKQYAGMVMLIGEPKTREKKVNADQLLLF
ncbi:CRISPR-associated endonuclease Cas2 [Neisseria animalis]|uniref:CRISPR-associated endoribonuclease Cas2 n=1 Tax=Neisseria animalis TaxID=492 RepID=A0A5P3MRI0_NEIAN|nr:CRISPR-associated endonuclease Cas2 [Neisseria animalis]QEY24216.1 CRISPR-associated endonuclease Cas2 [Neisseria animalis]ROW32254.1 CRISPR-associated endonuclease Cas2 [Neisseria animalis]